MAHEVVTHSGDTVPAGGGVLVAWSTDHDYDSQDPGVVHPEWRFKEKKRKVKATITELAPGLAVYVPRVKKGRHTVTLWDGAGGKLGTYKFGGKGTAPAAPSVSKVARVESEGFRGGTEVTVTAEVAAVPADVYGLIVYDAQGSALSWRRIDDPAATSFVVYDSPGHCGIEPEGMRPPDAGAQVTFAWVDKLGQVSAHSAAVAVR